MSNINYNLYRIFCAVANSKSYAEAGEKLGFTSANISTQIKNLEKQLDVKLFNRENDGVKLTEEGKQLFEIVNKSISSFDFAEKVIKEKNDLANGTVNIGCQSHLTNYYLMEYIKAAKNDYPNLNVELTCGAVPNEMFEMLKNHKLDFVITDVIPTETDGIVIEELKKVSNIFVAKEPLKIEDVKELEDLRYILNFDNTNSTKNLFKVLKEHKIKIKPYILLAKCFFNLSKQILRNKWFLNISCCTKPAGFNNIICIGSARQKHYRNIWEHSFFMYFTKGLYPIHAWHFNI